MAVPKRKTSYSKKRLRASHHALTKLALPRPEASSYALYSHHINPDGSYKSKKVVIKALARKYNKRLVRMSSKD